MRMNYKLEKFWNDKIYNDNAIKFLMNYKLEKFWNDSCKKEFATL